MQKLIIVAGPTAVGKTAYAISLAQQLSTEIISCDSRQFYRELRIGVARPSPSQLLAVKHHFIASRSVTNPYNISLFEADAIPTILSLFRSHHTVVAVGGSGLYIDALIRKPSPLPDPSPQLRQRLALMPLPEKQATLKKLDPLYYARVDLHNPVRIQRALEVSLTSGIPYSSLISQQTPQPRPFDIEVHILHSDKEPLRQRINTRVDQMMDEGLLDEVRSLIPLRHLNTLRTVGYSELFPVFDGSTTIPLAIEQIKLNTWHYARKQILWFKRRAETPANPTDNSPQQTSITYKHIWQ